VLVALLSLPAVASADVSSVTVYGSTTTVRPDQALPPGGVPGATGPSLRAARNEFESFQLAIETGAGGANLTVAPGDDLTRQGGGGLIPIAGAGSSMTIYREGFYEVDADPGRSDEEGDFGLWPDALIPEIDPVYGENRNAFPHAMAADQIAVAWIDVFVPPGTAPGFYEGSVLVRNGGETAQTVPVSMTVEGANLPSTSSLDNLFPTRFNDACLAHAGSANCGGDQDRRWRLQALYARVGLENRVTLSNPVPTGFDQAPTSAADRPKFEEYILPLINGSGDGAGIIPRRLNGAELTVVHAFWQCLETAGCLAAWKTLAEEDGFADKFVMYSCDEPPNAISCDWEQAAARMEQAEAIWPGVPRLATTTIQQASDANVADVTDILVPNMTRLDGWNCCGFPYIGDQRAEYDGFLAANPSGAPNRMWAYSSDSQHGSNFNTTGQFARGWPGYVIDAPAAQARAMSWLMFEYQTSGELYYQTTEKLPTAWNQDGLAFSGGHGDGTLFYPGTPARIGGDSEIPVESIRLKRIREGREDYELLRLAEQASGFAAANAAAEGLFGPRRTLDEQVADGTDDSAMHNVTGAILNSDFDGARAELFALLPDPVNTPPVLAAIGDRLATVGEELSFQVSATDADADVLDYSAENLPPGAGFDPATRTFSWTPAAGQVGEFEVTFEVSDGEAVDSETITITSADNTTPVTCLGLEVTVGGATAGNDLLQGGPGNDVISGLGGDDDIRGGGGNDTICGDGGFDTIEAALGDDTLDAGEDGGAAEYGRSATPVVASLATGEAMGEGTDSLAGFSELYGSLFDDKLTGADADEYIAGNAGDDVVKGGDGKDILEGAGGIDKLKARDGTRDLKLTCGAGRGESAKRDRKDPKAISCR